MATTRNRILFQLGCSIHISASILCRSMSFGLTHARQTWTPVTMSCARRGWLLRFFNGWDLQELMTAGASPQAYVVDTPTWTGTPNDHLRYSYGVFSLLFSASVTPDFSEEYTLAVEADSGVRLWVDDTLVIDAWSQSGKHTCDIDLVAGRAYAFRLAYVHAKAVGDTDASVTLIWQSASQDSAVIPATSACADTAGTCPFGPGLTAQFYEESSLRRLVRQYNVMTETSSLRFSGAEFAELTASGSYAVRLVGYMRVPQSGNYSFGLNATGYTRALGILELSPGVTFAFGPSASTVTSPVVYLDPHLLYWISVEWASSNPSDGLLQLLWYTPWSSTSEPIPREAFCASAPQAPSWSLGRPGYLAEYFADTTFTSLRMLRMEDPTGVDWAAGTDPNEYAGGTQGSGYSVRRLSAFLPETTGVNKASVSTPRGARLSVGGRQLVDQLQAGSASRKRAVGTVASFTACYGDPTQVSFEFQGNTTEDTSASALIFSEDRGPQPVVQYATAEAVCKLGTDAGLVGEYYAGTHFQAFQFARVDPFINLTLGSPDSWAPLPPVSGMPPAYFSVRWTGFLVPPATDTYLLKISCILPAACQFCASYFRLYLLDVQIFATCDVAAAAWSAAQRYLQLNGSVSYPIRLDVVSYDPSPLVSLYWRPMTSVVRLIIRCTCLDSPACLKSNSIVPSASLRSPCPAPPQGGSATGVSGPQSFNRTACPYVTHRDLS